MTDTTPVPSDLLARIAAASAAGKVEEVRSLATELPVPTVPALPPSPFRIIDIGKGLLVIDNEPYMRSRHVEFDPVYIDRLVAQPDPMTLIEHALTHNARGHAEDSGPDAYIRVENALDRIRAALEGATQ